MRQEPDRPRLMKRGAIIRLRYRVGRIVGGK